jgi:hypothetical protein
VGDIALAGATRARQALTRPRDAPAQRVRLLDDLQRVLLDTDVELSRIHPPGPKNLVGPLARARQRLIAKLAQAHTQLSNGIRISMELSSFLVGPRTYLVLGGNNAEMRAGGIPTAAGLVHVIDGDLQVSRFIDSADLQLPEDRRVAVNAELASLYQSTGIGREWRATATSPNWPAVADIYARMSAQSPFGPVDGVLFVDVVALRSILQGLGTVTVNGIVYNANNVEEQLLYRNYLRYSTLQDVKERHDEQSLVASAIFQALRTRSLQIGSLGHSLSQAIKGRHLLAWGSRPEEQDLWTQVGASGAIAPFGMMVSPQNASANKLDYFIKPTVTMTVRRTDTYRQVNMTVTVTNPPRVKTSPIIEGSQAGSQPGDHEVNLLLYLPSAVFDVGNAKPGFSIVGTDGGMKVVGLNFTTAVGHTSNIDVSFRLPLSWAEVVLLPSGRLTPIPVTVNNLRYTDAVPVAIPV